MRFLKSYLRQKLFRFAGLYREPTMTEQAFHALHTLEKMRSYIYDQEPTECWPPLSDELIRKYHIRSHADIWGALERARQNKLL